jgi:NitT/TauT family transport system substrate-binding protein
MPIRNVTRRHAILAAASTLTLLSTGRTARAVETIRIGQATTSLSFLPLWAARALDTFAAQNLSLDWAAIPGGDPSTLAALDSGDIDLAAVGSDTLIAAAAKGQPFAAVATLMDRVSLDLVVSEAFLKKSGVSPGDPLEKRVAALKGATVGVSAVGGAQDRAVRWLAAHGGIVPSSVQVALVGGPPALQAALEHGQIDAFILSPPEGQIAAAGGYGRVLVSMSTDFPELRGVPFLVLAAKLPVADPGKLERVLRALAAADDAILANQDKVADAIQQRFFPKIAPAIIRAGVVAMRDGVADKGKLDQPRADAALRFTRESGVDVSGLGGKPFWTATYIDAALR